MTDKEKIIAEIDKIIDRLKTSCNPNPLGTTEECLVAAEIEALELVKDIIVKMKQEEPVSKDLEEAAIAYCGGNKGSDARVRTAYIMGANWKTDRLLKDAVCATIDYPIIGSDFPNIYPNYRELKDYCDKHNIKDDDKVKIIIVKEE